MRIYVSGSFSEQERLRKEAHELLQAGHHITSTWLNEVKKPPVLTDDEWNRCLAVKDLAEVAAADCIICDLDANSTTGGRYVEFGFALGRYNMLKLVVGKDTHGVFNALADYKFKNWEEVKDHLQERMQ